MPVMLAKAALRLLSCLVAAGNCGLATASVVYVDDDAAPGGSGASWGNAFRFLQDALGYAAVPANGVNEIRVAAGLYLTDRSEASPGGTGERSAAFPLIGGLALRGGYAGPGAADPDQRDTALHGSALSGDLAGDDLPDLVNVAENSYHVLEGVNAQGAVLDGFVIMAGNADVDLGGLPHGHSRGGGLYVAGGSVTVIGCAFRANQTVSEFYANGGSALFCKLASVELVDCLFSENRAAGHGGAAHFTDCPAVTLTGCTFVDNRAAIGAGIRTTEIGTFTLTGCTFQGNEAAASTGGVFASGGGVLTALDCLFIGNSATLGEGGLVSGSAQTNVVNCAFVQNTGGVLGGGFNNAGGVATLVNCVFSRNNANHGAAVYAGISTFVKNCTLAGNGGSAIAVDGGVTLSNSVVWSSPVSFGPSPGGYIGAVAVTSSDVQGGWAGAGNINADPLFVQPGLDDLRLSFGSPCLNAGSNAALPPDAFDLDGDGDIGEPLPLDLDGALRVQAGSVDMGAYEGEFPPGGPAASEGDLDQGESALLVPAGGAFNPLVNPAVIVVNASGPDGATYLAEQYEDLHAGAGGYQELASVLHTQTSLSDGEYVATVFIPFTAAGLAGREPHEVEVVWYDPAADAWALGVSGNAGDSPGFNGPVGNRIMSLAGGAWNVSSQVGDYGVFWDPQSAVGCAWANLDHVGDVAAGASPCRADCRQSPDGAVGIVDLLALLLEWGVAAGGGPCDLDFDGEIGQNDMLALLADWGDCTQPAAAGGNVSSAPPVGIARSADLDGSGSVDQGDFEMLRVGWGPCQAPCPRDLDGDGRVSARDVMELFARWGREDRPEAITSPAAPGPASSAPPSSRPPR